MMMMMAASSAAAAAAVVSSSSSSLSVSPPPPSIHTQHRSPSSSVGGGGGGGGGGGQQYCVDCNKVFTNKSALAKHRLIHSNERKYACTQCEKSFKRQDHLNGHMLTHAEKKPFECRVPNCDKSYCDSRSLKRHVESQHQDYLARLAEGNADALNYLPSIGKLKALGVTSNEQVREITVSESWASQGDTEVKISDDPQQQLQPQYSPTLEQPKPKSYFTFEEPKPERCKICNKGFKNIPALNGHMRLHGGFTKVRLVFIL